MVVLQEQSAPNQQYHRHLRTCWECKFAGPVNQNWGRGPAVSALTSVGSSGLDTGLVGRDIHQDAAAGALESAGWTQRWVVVSGEGVSSIRRPEEQVLVIQGGQRRHKEIHRLLGS